VLSLYADTLAAAGSVDALQPAANGGPQTTMIYILSGLVGTLLGFLMREVIKRLDKQIELSGVSKDHLKKVEDDIERLQQSQIDLTRSLTHLTNNVATLASSIAQISARQTEHLNITREQVQLAKRWHDKLDHAWPIENKGENSD
jgi:hypothetical protein